LSNAPATVLPTMGIQHEYATDRTQSALV